MKSEHSIQDEIRIELSKLGYIVFRQSSGTFLTMDGRRTVSVGVNGMCDLLAIAPNGEHIWLETKRVGGRKGGEQRAFIEAMRSRGVKAGFCDSVESAIAITKDGLF